jgi:hypothetical protein
MPCWFALLTAEGERRTVALGRAEVLGGGDGFMVMIDCNWQYGAID